MLLTFFIKCRTLYNKLHYNSIKLLRFFNGYSFPFPREYLVILTYKCNFNCAYCIIDRSIHSSLEFTLEKFKLLEKNCRRFFNFRKTRYTLMGGEPTIARDFLPIIEYLSKQQYKISIRTNGFISENTIRKIVEIPGVDRIFISLQASDYEQTISTIKKFKKYGVLHRIHIYLTCTINYVFENGFSLKEIARKFENSGVRHIRFQHSMSIFSLQEKYNLALLKKQLTELKKTKFNTNVFVYPNIEIKDIEKYYLDKNYPNRKIKCYSPWEFPVLIPNGDVVPCFCSDVMGNLYVNNIREIWNGEKYIEFRRNIQKKGTQRSECARCVFREF